MHRIRVLAVALFAVAASAFAQDARVRAFEQFAEEAMKAQKMPGLSVAVKHGDFHWSRGFGFADLENEVPARADSSYRMASVTKPMTAVAVLKLVEDGRIDLDAEVQTYVPYFPRKAQKITVRQLLAHQGGISHYRDYDKEGHIRDPKSTREAIAIFADWDLVAEPGTSYRYSSYGYNLLGAVIEGASGKRYGEYMTENVWKPLEMTSTRMDDPRALVPHRVTGYVMEGGQLRRSEYVDISSRFAGGGTRSTVDDMVRFVEGLGEGKVLKAESRDLAWTAMPTRDGRKTEYGLGFGSVSMAGRWGVEHGGSQQETRTVLLYLPREKFAVALASNFEDASLRVFEEKLVSLFLGNPREIGARSNDDVETNMYQAMNEAFLNGFAYYDRFGKPMTSDKAELAKAFRYFHDAPKDKKLVEEGANPAAGEPLTKVGSYIASVLDANGDLEVYHREGVLRFFSDYARVAKTNKLDKTFVAQLTKWSGEWAKVWTPELQAIDASTSAGLETLEKHRDELVAASLKPDFAGDLIDMADTSAQSGDMAAAMRAANLGYALYPRSPGLNGILGVLTLVSGDPARGKALLATSVQIDPRSYASANNLLNIANFLANGPTKPAAIALLEAGVELHPTEARLKSRLAELRQ